ncbi:unnamed protein product [Calypogeia fissa]
MSKTPAAAPSSNHTMEALLLRVASISLLCLCLSVVPGTGDRSGLLLVPKSDVAGATQEAAAYGVLTRLLPRHEKCFDFRIVSEDECGGSSCFQITNSPSESEGECPEIGISGTSGVELCAGLYWYLKRWCGAHVSWEKTGGAQLQTVPEPGSLPRVKSEGVRVQRVAPWNYYQNVVTSSYSFVWWNWERWEKEIDWMALQGVNLPLAFTGQEAIWQKVFQSGRFNLSKSDLDDYFGGPAFLAWARMGNLHGWGGPLPQSWLDQQLLLQLQILSRMRALGMIPVLPAFSGNVPPALQKIFPSAKITRLGDWNTVDGDTRWCCTYLLDPTDPLFVELGKTFVEQQIKEYGGTQHIYNCDTFNENLPPTDDPTYISTLGAAVYEAMRAGDSQAVWLMQGWLFSSDDWFWKPPQTQALLHSVPVGKMVVLDLFAEVKPVWQRTNHFYGVPYIWCMLHDFGGNVEMYGRLDTLGVGPIEALGSSNSTMVGVGTCMEGIEQNPVVYELMGEMSFHNQPVQMEGWVADYATRRYGKAADGAQAAWEILHRSIYNCGDGVADHNGDVIVEFPDIYPSEGPLSNSGNNPKQNRRDSGTGMRMFEVSNRRDTLLGHTPHLWYSPGDAVEALGLLLSSADELGSEKTYRYDLVDLTRQVLSKLANEWHAQILAAFQLGKVKEVQTLGAQFLDLMADMERVLASCDGFLLGPWLESAKLLSTNEEEKELYEWNARTQITMWFDNTEDEPSPLHDYANKMWSGLLNDYYLPRASLYISLLQKSVEANATFPFELWRKEWISLTNNWQVAKNNYSVIAVGDTIEIVDNLYYKYKDLAVSWSSLTGVTHSHLYA